MTCNAVYALIIEGDTVKYELCLYENLCKRQQKKSMSTLPFISGNPMLTRCIVCIAYDAFCTYLWKTHVEINVFIS